MTEDEPMLAFQESMNAATTDKEKSAALEAYFRAVIPPLTYSQRWQVFVHRARTGLPMRVWTGAAARWLAGIVALILLVGSCALGQISCQDRLHAQGVPFGDDRMEECFR